MSSTHRRLGPGWQALPHYLDALREAECIISMLWRHPVYGRSRQRNQSGATRVGARAMDRLGWHDVHHAICATTKIILRDRYNEWPISASLDDLSQLGKIKHPFKSEEIK